MITAGIGNSVTFREVNGQAPSFDNTFLQDEYFFNHVIVNDYVQEYFVGSSLVLQCKVTSGDVPTAKRTDCDGNETAMSCVLKTSYTDYDFYEITHVLASGDVGKVFYYTFSNAGDNDWCSERIKVINESDTYIVGTSISSYLKLEWFNYDATTGRANNNFEMDYSTGIVPFCMMQAIFKDYEPDTEISVYENLDEVTKLKEKIKRTLLLKTGPLPRYMIEKMVVATAHDNFVVNDVTYIRKDEPEITALENNLAEFAAVLTQQNVKGLNTSDIGFNCDTVVSCKVLNMTESGVSTNTSFLIPEGYILHMITVAHSGLPGSNTLCKFGRTVGDDDIGTLNASPNAIGEYGNNYKSLVKHIDYAPGGDTTLYVDVSGSSPSCTIVVQIIDKS